MSIVHAGLSQIFSSIVYLWQRSGEQSEDDKPAQPLRRHLGIYYCLQRVTESVNSRCHFSSTRILLTTVLFSHGILAL